MKSESLRSSFGSKKPRFDRSSNTCRSAVVGCPLRAQAQAQALPDSGWGSSDHSTQGAVGDSGCGPTPG